MKKSSQTVGILGYGEVGRAMARFFFHPKIKSRSRDDGLTGIDVLHVCIPYSNGFVKTVKETIRTAEPSITIIHSTVDAGTTRKIGGMVVHSPIRGIHPHLYKGIQTFVKFIGADDKKAADLAQKHLAGLGLKTQVFYPSETTELGKLLDTTYYGLCIAFHGEIAKMCRKYHVNFDDVATAFNTSYNEGYTKLDMKHFVRPVLTAPNPAIGGHCILPNTKILKKQFKSLALDLILSYRPKETK